MSQQNEGNELTVYPEKLKTSQPLSIEDIRKNAGLIKDLLKGALQKDVDFGVIPGCGDKPALLKPGAEKLMLMFKLGAFPEVTDLSGSDNVRYLIKTKIIHLPTGIELGIGVGECSTDEEKYKWKAAVCPEEFAATPEERKRSKWKRGYGEKKNYQIQQIRTNPADISNTVLKMAKKRSLIDAVISATAASDILTQDIEEIADENVNGNGNGNGTAAKPQVSKPQSKSATKQTATSNLKKMNSQYPGKCKSCNEPYAVGDEIYYSKQLGCFHVSCKDEPVDPSETRVEHDAGANG